MNPPRDEGTHEGSELRVKTEALRQSEERMLLMVESVRDYAIFMLDPEGRIASWNVGAERLKGYKAAEVIGKHFSLFYSEEDRRRGHPEEELLQAKAEGRYEEEGWRIRKDGSRFWANVVITAVFDHHGRHVGYGKVTRDFTQRRADEEKLRQSEERFRLLVENAREYAIFVLDPGGHIASWNAGAQRIKGYSADEIRGKHFSVFYTEEDRRRGHPKEVLALALANGSYSEEGWRVRKDGARFWASIVITTLNDEHGRLYGFGKVTRDLTARRNAEEGARRLAEAAAAQGTAETLQATTAAFASALTSQDVAKALFGHVLPALGADGGSLAVRIPGTEQLRLTWAHGYSEEVIEEYRQFSLQDATPHSEAARERRPIFVESREAINRAYPHVARINRLEGLASVPLIIKGECIGVMGISYSAPKTFTATEHALALAIAEQCALALDRALLFEREIEAKDRAHFLAEASAVLTRSLDYETILKGLAKLVVPKLGDWCAIEMVEGSATRQVAVAHTDPAKVALAREWREKFPPDPARKAGLFEVIRTGKPSWHSHISDELLVAAARSPEELRMYRELGMRAVMTIPLLSRDKAFGAMTLAWAETNRQYSQADLDFACELCNRAGLAVENAQLYEELQKAVRVRDDFMSIAGHEVRTPLAALQLNLQTIARSTAKDPALRANARLRERLEKALENGERLERLVEELLDVSRITSGSLKLECEDLNLTALVEGIVSSFAEQAERLGSELRLRSGGPLVGNWDRMRLEQVVSNLISNALKYGQGKPIEVETSGEDGFAVLRVRDFGIGIDPDHQKRIFERFERAVSARNYAGLGLGLWIARQVVEASSGTIAVESEPGKGALFTVKVPMHARVEEHVLN